MIHQILKDKKIVLASSSPRRKEIFKLMGIKYIQKSADVDESIMDNDHVNPRQFVTRQSLNKCKEVSVQMDMDCVVVAADTIVYLNKEILGKPVSHDEAFFFLKKLSGKNHAVYTGITIKFRNIFYSQTEKTSVTFKNMSDSEIREYLATGEPMDKAGAYGIQGYGAQFIEKISGCYFNVMGFPIHRFYCLLEEIVEKNKK